MTRRARLLSVAALLPFFAAPAMAQTAASSAPPASGPHPYFIGGLVFEHRDLGIIEVKSWSPAPVAGGGLWLNRFIGVDATAEISRSQSFDYTTSYSAPIRHRTGTHRDTMILGSLRVRPPCRIAVCVEVVSGAGLGFHHTSSLIREECGVVGVPKPCTPVNKLDWSESEPTLAASFGLDVPIGRPSSHVNVMPSMRVAFLDHTSVMRLHGSHEPAIYETWFFSAGLLISIR